LPKGRIKIENSLVKSNQKKQVMQVYESRRICKLHHLMISAPCGWSAKEKLGVSKTTRSEPALHHGRSTTWCALAEWV